MNSINAKTNFGPQDLSQNLPQKLEDGKYDRSLNLQTAECADLHSLTAIDMSLYETHKNELIKQLIEQMEGVGFCILKNVPGFDENELKKVIMAFHNDIPLQSKRCMQLRHFNNENTNLYRGFFPLIDNDPSHKQFYDLGRPLSDISQAEKESCVLYEDAPWLQDDPENKHRWILEKFYYFFNLFHQTSLKILNMLAIGLDKREDYFDPWFKQECTSALRAIHYLPRNSEKAAQSDKLDQNLRKLVTPEHADSGFVTLLNTFMYQGLQVEIDGGYKSVLPVHNTLVMNIGETLSKISGHRFKATRHRVLDIGCERYSCPFFLEPKFSALISDKIIQSGRQWCEDKDFDERQKQYATQDEILVPYGKLLCKKLTNSYGEWKGFEIPQELSLN